MFKSGAQIGLVAFALVAAVGLSACRHHSPEKRAEWIVGHISKKLDLNESQRKGLDEIKVQVLAIRAKHAENRTAQSERVKKIILGERLDRGEVRGMIDEHHQAMEKEFDGVFEKVAAFHATLTPEQKQKAVELIEKFTSRMHD